MEGEDKDRFVVIGEGVDFVRLTENLRKKLGFADIVSIGEVKKKESRTDYCSNIQCYPHCYCPSSQIVRYSEPYPSDPYCNIL